MSELFQDFITSLEPEQRTIAESIISKATASGTGMIGQLEYWYKPPSGRPLYKKWATFKDVIVMNNNGDWTAFGLANDGTPGDESIAVDLTPSRNAMEIRLADYYPFSARLNDPTAVSYRVNANQLVIRCVKVTCQTAYVYLTGMLAIQA